MNLQLSTGSWLPIRFLSRTLNWQLSARCHFDEAIIRAIWNWLPIRFLSRTSNWQLSTVSLLPIRWIYHKGYKKWNGNCQLAAGCQFDFYQELWIGNCQLSASCQFDESIIRAIWNEFATVNWQLAANSISIKNLQLTVANSKFLIEIELAASCQLTVANSFHIHLMIASSKWHLADSCQFKVLDRNWQLTIQSSW